MYFRHRLLGLWRGRLVASGPQAERDERDRIDFSRGLQILILLEFLQRLHRRCVPDAGACDGVTLARQGLLNFLVPFGRRCFLGVSPTGLFTGALFSGGRSLSGAGFLGRCFLRGFLLMGSGCSGQQRRSGEQNSEKFW